MQQLLIDLRECLPQKDKLTLIFDLPILQDDTPLVICIVECVKIVYTVLLFTQT